MSDNPRDILTMLSSPFSADEVDWRVGSTSKDKTSALALAYIDARTAMDRFDSVMGPLWQCSYTELRAGTKSGAGGGGGDDRAPKQRGSIVVCSISLKLAGEWISRADGAGDTAVEAEKGSMSDAFKRAAVRWGVGRYLYGFPSPWVKIDQYKKIERGEWEKLHKLSASALAQYKANPSGFRAPPPDAPPEREAPPTPAAARPPRAAAPDPTPADQPSSAPEQSRAAVLDFHKAAVLGAKKLEELRDAVFSARKVLEGAAAGELEQLFADRIEKGLAQADAELFNRLVAVVRDVKPRGPADVRVRGAIDVARARLAAAAKPQRQPGDD